jgi:peptidoglycan/LPS O-acetylase OafA/YrhL
LTTENYRHHIDGLRSLAVIAVIANHMSVELLPKGFLGVDIFFVISGFVITGSLINRPEHSLSSLYKQFFARRIKRLFPALLVCVVAASSLLYLFDPHPQQSLATGLFALFGFGNVALYNFEIDYFAVSSRFNAFTHTWSLGVEEQFYMFFPMVLWLLWLRRGERPSTHLLTTVILLSFCSLAAFLYLYESHNPAAYFLTPMRVWELGFGVIVYLLSQEGRHTPYPATQPTLALLAVSALVVCLFLPVNADAFLTLAVVLFTGMLLPLPNGSLVARAFSAAPLVYVGKLSYSLYLWHWPVLVMVPVLFAMQTPSLLLAIMIMVILSVVSYELIEKPLRYRRWTPAIRNTAVSAGVVGLAMIALLTKFDDDIFRQHSMFPPPFPKLIPSGRSYENCVGRPELQPFDEAMFQLCTVPSPTDKTMPTLWTMGDSHAGHLLGLLYESRAGSGVGVHLISTPGLLFPPRVWNDNATRERIYRRVLEQAKPGDILVVARLYFQRESYLEPARQLQEWLQNVETLIPELAKSSLNMVLVAPIPMFRFEDIRACLTSYNVDCTEQRHALATGISGITSQLEALANRHDNLFVFQPFPVLCPPTQERCSPMGERQFLYRDRDHLNAAGAASLAPAFTRFLQQTDLLPRVET